jgi:hypothetical protein
MLEIVIYVVLAILIIALLTRYEFKKLEAEVFQRIKRLGIKALSIIGIINIFTIGSEQLPENNDSSDEQETD